MHGKVIFLHIPKTAGQSVHAYLEQSAAASEICPARENWQLACMPIDQIRKYSVFSGHLDWSLLDCVLGTPFIFTILRDPLDRILSFYFFLRQEAAAMSAEELGRPHLSGISASLTLSPDEFFCGGPPSLRDFLDDHFDNFYTYYFCGRSFDARRRLKGLIGGPPANLTMDDLLNCAVSNLSQLSGVYRVQNLERLQNDIGGVLPISPAVSLASMRVNVGRVGGDDRVAVLREIGPAALALERIQEMSFYDRKIWESADLFR